MRSIDRFGRLTAMLFSTNTRFRIFKSWQLIVSKAGTSSELS